MVYTSLDSGLQPVSKDSPCRHCGKPDWCYRVGELDVCKRKAAPATGWKETGKADSEGDLYYAPIVERVVKEARPKQTRYWEYPTRDGQPGVRVGRIDDGRGNKKIWQEHWIEDPKLAKFRSDACWVVVTKKQVKEKKATEEEFQLFESYKDEIRKQIPIYRYPEIREAIAAGQDIHIAEGEPACDAFWSLGIPATTNIGGAGKWLKSNTADLEGAQSIVLCPDRDEPGLKHMMNIASCFPNVKWLLCFPDSPIWNNLPKNQGVDVVDWISDYKLSAEDIQKSVIDAETFRAKLEQQFTPLIPASSGDRPKKANKPPHAAVIAAELAEQYRSKLAWHDKEQVWYRYEADSPGIWGEESEIAVGAVVLAELEAMVGRAFGSAYVSDVTKLLKYKLLVKHWDEREDLIPLIDGVLCKNTLELLPHSPGYHLTWSVPIRWADRTIGCEPIKAWMLEIMKGDSACAAAKADRTLVEVLRALLNCVIFSRANYQRYLEAIGPGGTGKGTFFRLASALVGDKNVFPTTLKNLEENRFELAAAAKAKLIIITEAEKYGGEVNVLKALTGEDKNRIEIKGRQQKCGDGFTFKGFVFLSANEPCQNADYTSGLERRRLSVPFTLQTPPEKRRDLDEEFKPYLAGLLDWVLTMPESEVRALVLNTKKTVPALAKVYGEALCDSNPMADWLDNCIIHDPGTKTYVGVDDPEKVQSWLYANYVYYIRRVNGRTISTRRYSKLLEDLCCNQLKLKGVMRGRDRNGSYFEGLRIRSDFDNDPRPITGAVTDSVTECDGSVTAETLDSDGCDGCDGLTNNPDRSAKLDKTTYVESLASKSNLGGNADLRVNSVTEAETVEGIESHSSHPSITTHHNPSQVSPALQLAALLRSAQCWTDVEEALATAPNSKTEAWALLTAEEKAQIKTMKPGLTPNQVTLRETQQPQEPQSEQTWQVGQRVVVELEDHRRDLRSRGYDGRTGTVSAINLICEQCLVDFGDGDKMHIPFKSLKLEF